MLLSTTEICPKCGKNSPCNKVCLNKLCGDQYLTLICNFCHQEAHFAARNEFPDVDLDMLLYDFQTQISKIEEVDKKQYLYVLKQIDFGVQKISEITKIQNFNQQKLIDLKDELLGPCQKARRLIQEMQQEGETLEKVSECVKNILNLATYDKRIVNWKQDYGMQKVLQESKQINVKSELVQKLIASDQEKIRLKQIQEELRMKNVNQIQNFTTNGQCLTFDVYSEQSNRQILKKECLQRCNQYLQEYGISWRWTKYEEIQVKMFEYEEYRCECLKDIAENNCCCSNEPIYSVDIITYFKSDFQQNYDQTYDCFFCGKWRRSSMFGMVGYLVKLGNCLYNTFCFPIIELLFKCCHVIVKSNEEEFECGDGRWLGKGKGKELYLYFKKMKEQIEEI